MNLTFSIEDFFKDDLTVKLADHKLPRNVEEWEESIYGILFNTHPWFSEKDITFDLTKIDADAGTGVGSIIISKKLAIPVIVKDFKLKPLDQFLHDGKLKPLTENSFLKDTLNKEVGKVVNPGNAAVGLQPILDKVFPPYTGMQSFASFVDQEDMRKLIHDSFTDEQKIMAFNANSLFKSVIKDHLRHEKVASTDTSDDRPSWELMQAEIKRGDKARISYIHHDNEKIACLVGGVVLSPTERVYDRLTFGVETNADNPRYFIMNNNDSDVAFEPITKEDDHSICKSASRGGDDLEAYIVPVKDETVLIGPFTSRYVKSDGVEVVETFSGEVDLLDCPDFKLPFKKEGSLFIIGKGAVRVNLGSELSPMSVKEANLFKSASFEDLEDSDVVTLTPKPIGRHLVSIHYDGLSHLGIDELFTEMEKKAKMCPEVKKDIRKRFKRNKQVHVRMRFPDEEAKKYASDVITMAEGLLPFNREEIARAASLIYAPKTEYFARVHQVIKGYPADVSKIAAAQETKVKETVDSILSLNLITPETISKYVEKLETLEESLEICSHLLLLARLGFPLDEQPLKTAIITLDRVVGQLSTLRNASNGKSETVA